MFMGRRHFIQRVSRRPELLDSRSIAIIAIFPINQRFYFESLKNLLTGLESNGVTTIGVVNGAIPIEIESLLNEYKCSILIRKNKGRDFGAYQDGFNWLSKNTDADTVERIIFINDTLLWLPNSQQIIKDCLQDDWACLYFNLEQHAHAQSFFMCFSKKVIQNKKFRKFWRNYPATKYRRSAIINGEMGLSTVLLKEGFSCSPLVTSEWIQEGFRKSQIKLTYSQMLNFIEINRLWKVEVPGAPRHKVSLVDENKRLEDIAKTKSLLLELDYEISLTPLVISQYCHSQGPHRVGLILYLLFGLPLKADLYKANSLSEIFAVVNLRNPTSASSAHEFYSLQSQRYMLGTRANNRSKRRGEK
jgi:hypothetical protein